MHAGQGRAVALALEGACIHCRHQPKMRFRNKINEMQQSNLDDPFMSESTKNDIRDILVQEAREHNAEEKGCPIRKSMCQIAEARQKQAEGLLNKQIKLDEARAALRKIVPDPNVIERSQSSVEGSKKLPRQTLSFQQAKSWTSCDFYNAVPDEVVKRCAAKARSQARSRSKFEDSDTSDDERELSPRHCFRINQVEASSGQCIVWRHCVVKWEWLELFRTLVELAKPFESHYCGVTRFVQRRFIGDKKRVGHCQKYRLLFVVAFAAKGISGVERSCIDALKNSQVGQRNKNIDLGGGGYSCLNPGFLYPAVSY